MLLAAWIKAAVEVVEPDHRADDERCGELGDELGGHVGCPSPFRSAGHGSADSRTRPPVGEEGEEVGCADVAVVIEIPRALSGGGGSLVHFVRHIDVIPALDNLSRRYSHSIDWLPSIACQARATGVAMRYI